MTATTTTTNEDTTTTVQHVAAELIDNDPNNRAVSLDTAFIESIRTHGVLQPAVIVTNPTNPERFVMVAGHRRLAASVKVGHPTIPAIVRDDLDAKGRADVQLIENLMREDLTPTQEARALVAAIGVGHTVKTLATLTKHSQKWVKERLTIAELPAVGRKRIDQGQWSIADGIAAARLMDSPEDFAKVVDTPQYQSIERVVANIEANNNFAAAATKMIEAAAKKGIKVVDADAEGVHLLSSLGLSDEDHQGEECHAVALQGRPPSAPRLAGVCTSKSNHTKKGPSATKLPAKTSSLSEDQRAANAAKRDAQQARNDAMHDVATGKLAKAAHVDLIEATLLQLVSADTAKRALRLLGVDYDKKHYEPTVLAEWADLKPAHMTQAVRAIALVEGDQRANRGWGDDGRKTLKAWHKFLTSHTSWKPSKWDKDQTK